MSNLNTQYAFQNPYNAAVDVQHPNNLGGASYYYKFGCQHCLVTQGAHNNPGVVEVNTIYARILTQRQ